MDNQQGKWSHLAIHLANIRTKQARERAPRTARHSLATIRFALVQDTGSAIAKDLGVSASVLTNAVRQAAAHLEGLK